MFQKGNACKRLQMQMVFQDPYASFESPYDGRKHHRGRLCLITIDE